ncbi:MAG: DUF2914 domain-containing protein [Proteobacteria bacterium]|nr:DUF2914 domain-containing protein [Pseudomonadota bacterium]
MKRFCHPCIISAALVTICVLTLGATISAEQIVSLDTEFATVSRDIIDREPIDPGTIFPVSVGKLYFLTKIVNAQRPTEVTHVWYYGEKERARVTLPVNSSSWRTYSSKLIQPHEVGDWYVDVLDPEGDLLVSVPFKVTQN